ncbi:hypothetical protein ABZ892_33185 [Streptomyces sp. NPDC046924]|uniref:hypothetical protein n=1 Tax=Streptomyces sp. NPDC046924 TaxID=3155136 RepID=UPI0033C8AF38
MSWVWIGRSGVAVDIFLPQDERWDDALDTRWTHQREGLHWNFPLREQRDSSPRRPSAQAPADDLGPLLAGPPDIDEPHTTIPPGEPRPQAVTGSQGRADRLVQRLYDTAPELDAELAGIPVRGTWAPADALGPAQHEVLLAVLAERPPRQADLRARLARTEGRFDACLDGRVLTVVRPTTQPSPGWHDLEQVLLDPA